MGNAINGGFKLATTRLLLGLDLLVSNNISAGVRFGYGLNVAAPADGAHAELRFAYWLGTDPFKQQKIRPYLALMGGYADMEAKLGVPIAESAQTVGSNAGRPPSQTLQVWRKSGPVFAGVGGGVMVPTGKSGGVLIELKLEATFPNSGFAISPSIGYAIGL